MQPCGSSLVLSQRKSVTRRSAGVFQFRQADFWLAVEAFASDRWNIWDGLRSGSQRDYVSRSRLGAELLPSLHKQTSFVQQVTALIRLLGLIGDNVSQ